MNIYYVRSLFRLGESPQSKAGYVLADTTLEAVQFACDKINTYGEEVDIHHIEAKLRKDEISAMERAKEQREDHWDGLYSWKRPKKH
jgi:hypothetical protein